MNGCNAEKISTKVSSKAEFFELWHKGVLGNRTRLTQDPEEAWSWGASDYGFRFAKRGSGGGGLWSGVGRDTFWPTIDQWNCTYGLGNYYIDDRVPDHFQTIQGEICRTFRGLQGFIGASHYPMRVAMQQGLLTPRSSVETLVLINTFMDPSSRDDVDQIFDLFPDATIEFTCFSCNVGVLQRNTMFWEVRNY